MFVCLVLFCFCKNGLAIKVFKCLVLITLFLGQKLSLLFVYRFSKVKLIRTGTGKLFSVEGQTINDSGFAKNISLHCSFLILNPATVRGKQPQTLGEQISVVCPLKHLSIKISSLDGFGL